MPDIDPNDPRVMQLRGLFNLFADEREAERARKDAEEKEAAAKKKKDEPGLFDFIDEIFGGK